MKKLGLIVLFLFISLFSFSQSKEKHPWEVQLSGGYQASNMAGKAARGSTTAFIGGALNDIGSYGLAGKRVIGTYNLSLNLIKEISETLDLGIGFGKMEQGGLAKVVSLDNLVLYYPLIPGKGNVVFRLNYLYFPVSLYLNPFEQHDFYFHVQGWYARLKSANELLNFNSSNINPPEVIKWDSNAYNRYQHDNLGMSAGVGYKKQLIRHLNVSVQISYTRGFKKIIAVPRDIVQETGTSSAFIQSVNADGSISFIF